MTTAVLTFGSYPLDSEISYATSYDPSNWTLYKDDLIGDRPETPKSSLTTIRDDNGRGSVDIFGLVGMAMSGIHQIQLRTEIDTNKRSSYTCQYCCFVFSYHFRIKGAG
jgi:hypothetical protein